MTALDVPVCSCGKRQYTSRKVARRAIRRGHVGEHMSIYPCPSGNGLFHVGHLPRVVITGEVGRDQLTPRRTTP